MQNQQPVMVPPVLDGARVVNIRPVRKVTQEEIDAFLRDGVVKLEGILPVDSITYLGEAMEDIFRGYEDEEAKQRAGPGLARRTSNDQTTYAEEALRNGKGRHLLVPGGYKEGETQFTGRAWTEVSVFNWHTDFHRFCAQGPLPEVVAQLLQTSRLQFYADHLFYKEAGSLLRTGFHQDAAAFPLIGEQIAIAWVPCDVVTKESGCMCYIRGSHRWKRPDGGEAVYQMNNLVTDKADGAQPVKEEYEASTGLPPLPDVEHNEGDYDIVYITARPGDVIVHHNRTVHGSYGNSSDRHRRGASCRYVGDDVVVGHLARSQWAGTALATSTKESPLAKQVASGQHPSNARLVLNNRSKQASSGGGSGSSPSTNGDRAEPKRGPSMGARALTEGEPLPPTAAWPVVWPKADMPSFAKL